MKIGRKPKGIGRAGGAKTVADLACIWSHAGLKLNEGKEAMAA